MFQFIGNVFNTFVGKPIFNLLIVIIALMPGHNLGWAIIVFTILVRLALYPLLKKQLHHTMAMKKLQPELRKIKKQAAGDRQKEARLMQELYKEREVKPFATFGILLAQLPILLALFYAINKIVNTPDKLVENTYAWVQNLPFTEVLIQDISRLDTVWLGFVDLTHTVTANGSIGALLLAVTATAVQFYQSKQLMMNDKNARGLRQILKDSSQGKEVDQAEIQAATSKFTLYIIPLFLFLFSINIAAAFSLYWTIGGLVALLQQTRILKKDFQEMDEIAGTVTANSKNDNYSKAAAKAKKAQEASVIETTSKTLENIKEEPKVHKKTGVKTYIKTADEESPAKTSQSKSKKTSKKKSKKKKRRR